MAAIVSDDGLLASLKPIAAFTEVLKHQNPGVATILRKAKELAYSK